MREPTEPGYTCKGIDTAISAMEDVRKENEALRAWGQYWKERCEDAEEQAEKLENEVSSLQDQLAETDHA